MSLLGGTTASKFGWQSTFLLPGIWTMFSAFIAFFGISNSPNEENETKKTKPNQIQNNIQNNDQTDNNSNSNFKTPTKVSKTNSSNVIPATPSVPSATSSNVAGASSGDTLTFSQVFKQHLLKNFRLWLLCFASLFHDIARTGWADWGYIILVKQKEFDTFIAGR